MCAWVCVRNELITLVFNDHVRMRLRVFVCVRVCVWLELGGVGVRRGGRACIVRARACARVHACARSCVCACVRCVCACARACMCARACVRVCECAFA